jgi:hypothetical protein
VIYDWLQPIEPWLAGPWRWATYAVACAGVGLVAWSVLGRRWRPDGVRRCIGCRHAFDPRSSFDGAGMRCTECGRITATERQALRRPGRTPWVVAGIGLAVVALAPVLAWHGAHILVARTILPRWVAVNAAMLPDGATVVLEGDPLQAWLGWEPNPDPGAWDGMFLDRGDAEAPLRWPNAWRMRIVQPSGEAVILPEELVGALPPVFGAAASELIPTEPVPGFGLPLAPDGACAWVIGAPNPGSGGGIEWHDLMPVDGSPTPVPIGWGAWKQTTSGGPWSFWRRCHGFRYQIVAGAFLHDQSVACSWDSSRGVWRTDARWMRRPVDADALARCALKARESFEQCAVEGLALDADGVVLRDGRTPTAFFPCPEMVGAMARGVLEHVFTGNGAEWRAWTERAWPPRAGIRLRDAFVVRMAELIDDCECAGDLRELNGQGPEVKP